MTKWHEFPWIDLGTELLDRQVVSVNGTTVGKVDEIELHERPDGRVEVQAVVVGTSALLDRLDGWARWLLRQVLRPFGGLDEPRCITFDQIVDVASAVTTTESAAQAAASRAEQRVQRSVINRIPGAGHADR